jgi:hypothetical protein
VARPTKHSTTQVNAMGPTQDNLTRLLIKRVQDLERDVEKHTADIKKLQDLISERLGGGPSKSSR